MSRDPFSGFLGSSGSQNGYSYVHNNPVNLTDPTGNCPWCLVAAGTFYVGNVIQQTHNNMQNGMDFWDAIYYKNHNQAEIIKAIKNGLLLPAEVLPGVDGAIDGFIDQLIDNLVDPCAGLGDDLLKSSLERAAIDLAFFGFGNTISKGGGAVKNGIKSLDNVPLPSPPKRLLEAIATLQKRYDGQGIRMITAIYDETTNKIYVGIAGRDAASRMGVDEIHPIIQKRISDGFEHVGDIPQSKTIWPDIMNCSECRALNKALKDGADESNLHIFTWRPNERNLNNQPNPWHRCDNCVITVTSDKSTIWSESEPWNNFDHFNQLFP